ncbi:MAG: aldo/keto reductase [Thermoleophilaceae bacterium]|nr:aldo/keto reductase [Thermoleophilaceae bacterium]
MERRRLGRLEQLDSVLVYGGAALGEVTQDAADSSIAAALAAGVNHFDTAAAYGDSELRLAPWMPRIRDEIFLSTKTGDRGRDDAKRSIERSLERLGVERVDLLQLHEVGDLDQLDLATAADGALEAAIEAREQGLVGAIGITGHGHAAPATHLEALRRFPFDTVLTPWNFALSCDEAFSAAFDALVEEIGRQDAGLMTIKTVSRRNWPAGADQRYATWYEPFDHQEHIDAAVAFVLAHPAITSIAMVGDVGLMPMMLAAERRRGGLSAEQVERTLVEVEGYSSPFISMPL